MISAAAHGELMNPDTGEKFNEKTNWRPESCLLSREYFKWLGNLTLHDLERLANHILNQSGEKRKFPYPKVTIRSISSVLESCYSSKDWVERRKRKQLVKKELHNIDPNLGLMNSQGELILEKWKAFKVSHCITSASMNVLLERPGDAYFAAAKQLKSKNKSCAQISPGAAEFFQQFSKHKSGFEKPFAWANYRTYNASGNTFGEWPAGTWKGDSKESIKLGIIDLRELPGVQDFEVAEGTLPFFFAVLAAMEEKRSPHIGDINNWLIISGCQRHERQQALAYTQAHQWFSHLECDLAEYLPAKFERIGDVPAARALKKVLLHFYQNAKVKRPVSIPMTFNAPPSPVYTKPHGYDELEFRVYPTELRMDFYLWLMRKFLKPGESVFSLWGGGKITCAAMVSLESARLELIHIRSSVLVIAVIVGIFVFCLP